MARKKRSSRALQKAERRLAAIRSINHNLDLGDNLTAESYNNLIKATRQSIASYNTLLSKVDEASNQIVELEKSLSAFSENMLMGVAVKYGKDSNEYEMAGGTKRRKRSNSNHVEEAVIEPVTESMNGKQAMLN